jgi:hypothetical protein
MDTQAKKTFWQKLLKEIKEIIGMSLYFMFFLGILILLKKLILKDYQIEFKGLSIMIIGALVMAKVVLLMELIPRGAWVSRQNAIVDILFRTILYTIGVLLVLLLEKAFESRHEEGGFGAALQHVFRNRHIYQVWAGTIVISLSLLVFNMMSIMRLYLGKNQMRKLYFSTPLEQIDVKEAKKKVK